MRTLFVAAIIAAIAWPLLASNDDSRSGQPLSGRGETARNAGSGGMASSSANYSIVSQSVDSGGASAQSANYAIYVDGIGELDAGGSALVTSANYNNEIGYGGQLGGLAGPIIAVSRKPHGFAGAFDIALAFSGPTGIECRSGGASGDYQLVVTLAEPITIGSASVTSGIGSVPAGGASVSGNQITVNLTGVANAQYLTVALNNVADSQNNTVNVSLPMGVLVGDTNHDRFVDAIDTSQTKSQSGKALSNSNLREDVNVDGFIDAIDVALVKSKSGAVLSSQSSSPVASPTPESTSSPVLKPRQRKSVRE